MDGSAKSQFPPEVGARMDFHSDFHVYAVEDKNAVRYFVDGVQTSELTSFHVPIIPRWPFYLILNTAVSPYGLPDALDCDYDMYHYVDYVRVYRRVTKGAESRVWVFLASAAAGLVLVLALAACCAMRSALDDDDGGDSDDGVDRGADDAGWRRHAGGEGTEEARDRDEKTFASSITPGSNAAPGGRGVGRGRAWTRRSPPRSRRASSVASPERRAEERRGWSGLEGGSRPSAAHLRSVQPRILVRDPRLRRRFGRG